ncbi:MAG: hypothetical protein ACI9WT_001710 [Flavobacterium sp.]|jgi:hypothetical protein
MDVKKFLVSGFAGGIVDFLSGWFIYGILFKDLYPQGENMNILFIFLGCMTFGFFIAYIFTRWAGITNLAKGLTTGGVIGIFTSLSMNFFIYSNIPLNIENMSIDVVLSTIIAACVGTTVALVNRKMK